MTTTTNVQQVKVNVVTQAQYDSMTKNDNEFYVIKDKSYVENDSASVISALGYPPYDSSNPDGYITASALSGYEQTSHKVTSITSSSTDTQYPSAKAVYTATNANATAISTINGKIPSQATTSNQLADKAFVNSSISTNTANFIGTFQSVAALEAYSGTKTNNDYAFVETTDTAGNTFYDRYKYNSSTSTWVFEYELNNSSFTAAQWATINSGCTSTTASQAASALQSGDNISLLNNNAGYITGINSSMVTTALGYTPVSLDTAQTITGNKTFSGTVALGSSATATTPTTSDSSTKVATTAFVKNQGYITGITSSMVTSALGYTPYNSTNPNGYISGITSSMVTNALGYTPYNSTNPNGYISGITSSMVTTALGFTPANASNVQTVQDVQPIMSSTTTMSDAISMYSLTVNSSSTINNLTFNYAGTAGKSYTFELMINMSSVQQVTFNNVHWMDGEIPDLSTTGVYFLAFRKVGNSSIWYGNLQGKWTP